MNVYKAESTKEEKSLDSGIMALIAPMSGGDFDRTGIPGCGIQIACEVARAGFGRDLCQLSKDDIDGITDWIERLERKFQMHESKFFLQKRRNLRTPETFPDHAIWA